MPEYSLRTGDSGAQLLIDVDPKAGERVVHALGGRPWTRAVYSRSARLWRRGPHWRRQYRRDRSQRRCDRPPRRHSANEDFARSVGQARAL